MEKVGHIYDWVYGYLVDGMLMLGHREILWFKPIILRIGKQCFCIPLYLESRKLQQGLQVSLFRYSLF